MHPCKEKTKVGTQSGGIWNRTGRAAVIVKNSGRADLDQSQGPAKRGETARSILSGSKPSQAMGGRGTDRNRRVQFELASSEETRVSSSEFQDK